MGIAKKIPQELTVMVKVKLLELQCSAAFGIPAGKSIEYLCLSDKGYRIGITLNGSH